MSDATNKQHKIYRTAMCLAQIGLGNPAWGRKTVAGGGQIDAGNPCHLAITRRRGFVPENTAIAPSLASRYATHAFLFLIMSVRPGPHSDSDDSDRAHRQLTQISGKVPKANKTTRQGIRIANGTIRGGCLPTYIDTMKDQLKPPFLPLVVCLPSLLAITLSRNCGISRVPDLLASLADDTWRPRHRSLP